MQLKWIIPSITGKFLRELLLFGSKIHSFLCIVYTWKSVANSKKYSFYEFLTFTLISFWLPFLYMRHFKQPASFFNTYAFMFFIKKNLFLIFYQIAIFLSHFNILVYSKVFQDFRNSERNSVKVLLSNHAAKKKKSWAFSLHLTSPEITCDFDMN